MHPIVALASVVAGALAIAACTQAPPPPAGTAAPTTAAAATAPAGTTPAAQATAAPTTAPAAKATAVPTAAAPSGRFTYGYASFPSSMDPHAAQFTTELHMLRGVYDGLLELGQDGVTLSPALATSWRNVDPTTWEFKLRTDVVFHNGQPFNAEVVKWNVERAANVDNRLVINTTLASLLREARVIAPDTVQIVVSRPDPTVPRLLFPLLMIHPSTVETIRTDAVGTGPLRVQTADTNVGVMTQVPAQQSWRGPVRPAEVTIRRIAEAGVRAGGLQTGEVDITVLPPDLATQFSGPNYAITQLLNGSSVSLEMFPADTTGPLADLRVRQAVQLALNNREIVDVLFRGEGYVNPCQLTDPRAFGYNPNLQATPHDLNRARQLLAEAGYPNGFDARLLYVPPSTIIGSDVAQAVAGQLLRAGIRIELVGVEFAVYNQVRSQGGQPDFVLQVGNFSQTMDTSTPLAIYRYTGRAPAARFNNPEFNAAYDAATSEFNVERREQLLQQAARILCEQQGTAFMFQNNTQYTTRSRIDGFKPGPDLNPWFWTVGVRN